MSKRRKKGGLVSFVRSDGRSVVCRYSNSVDDVVWVLFSFSTWRATKQTWMLLLPLFSSSSLSSFFCTTDAYPDESRLSFIFSRSPRFVDFEFLCFSTRLQRVADSRHLCIRWIYNSISRFLVITLFFHLLRKWGMLSSFYRVIARSIVFRASCSFVPIHGKMVKRDRRWDGCGLVVRKPQGREMQEDEHNN